MTDAELDALLVADGWKQRAETFSDDAWRALGGRAVALLADAVSRELVIDPTWVGVGHGFSIDVRDRADAPSFGRVRLRAIVGADLEDRLTNQAFIFFYVDGVRVAPTPHEYLWATIERDDHGLVRWRAGGWDAGVFEDEFAAFATFDAHRTLSSDR